MYSFDTPIDRRRTGSFKWDEAREGVLPMWVADMDFAVAPCILHAIQQRAAHPVFGYVSVPDSHYHAVIDWYEERHGWKIERDAILTTTGVVPAVSAILQSVIQPGEQVIVHTPAYNCFFSSIRNSGAVLSPCPLKRIEIDGQTFSYQIDLEDLESRCANPAAKVLILCNPHNPSGRCWTYEELIAVADICQKHGILVISDEIHGELTPKAHPYTPWGTLPEKYQDSAVVCVSASKTFNIAGLQMAHIICPDSTLRARIDKRININETCDVGSFGYIAADAAFSEEGALWLDNLREYITENYNVFVKTLHTRFPQLPVARLEATYLVWVDVTVLGIDSEEIEVRLEKEADLWVNAGAHYGEQWSGCAQCSDSTPLRAYLRFNIACPRAQMLEGLRRFMQWVDAFESGQ